MSLPPEPLTVNEVGRLCYLGVLIQGLQREIVSLMAQHDTALHVGDGWCCCRWLVAVCSFTMIAWGGVLRFQFN